MNLKTVYKSNKHNYFSLQSLQAYHKANDERKQYVVEINSTKGNIDGNKARQRAAVGVQQREVDDMSRSPRLMG